MDAKKKRCSLCKEIKSISDFYKRPDRAENSVQHICKTCNTIKTKEHRTKNPSASRKASRNWQKNNPIHRKEILDKWRREHPEELKKIVTKARIKYRGSVKGKLNSNMSTHVWYSLRGVKGYRKWEKLTGYTYDQLKKHLESQFKDGMNWGNYGQWHIDHKIPLAAFNITTAEDIDFKRAWDLKNLQPMWAKENISKGAKLKKPFQPSLAMAV